MNMFFSVKNIFLFCTFNNSKIGPFAEGTSNHREFNIYILFSVNWAFLLIEISMRVK